MPTFMHPMYSKFTIKLCGTSNLIMFSDNSYTTEDPDEIAACRATEGVLELGNDALNAEKEAVRTGQDELDWEVKKNIDGQILQTVPVFKSKSGRRKQALDNII